MQTVSTLKSLRGHVRLMKTVALLSHPKRWEIERRVKNHRVF